MRAAVQIDLGQRLPMHLMKQGRVLRLHVRVERAAAERMRRTHRQPDQRRASALERYRRR